MTYTQIKIVLVIAALAWGLGVGTILRGESQPTVPAERDLQVEMDAYVDEFIGLLGIKYEEVQWASLVQPVLFHPDTAMVYHWQMSNDATLAVFTWDAKRMLRLSKGNRRAVAAHEVGHISDVCRRIVAPETEGFTEFERYLADFYYQLLNEGCADVVAAEMTSYPEMVTLLTTLRSYFLEGEENNVLNQRILILEDVIAKEKN